MKPGNSCLYFLQQTCNILILISGLLIIGLGIYLWVDTKVFSFIEIVFFALGGAEIIVSLLGTLCSLIVSAELTPIFTSHHRLYSAAFDHLLGAVDRYHPGVLL
jgi:hypothetical protein